MVCCHILRDLFIMVDELMEAQEKLIVCQLKEDRDQPG
jgi:hypothetical protein